MKIALNKSFQVSTHNFIEWQLDYDRQDKSWSPFGLNFRITTQGDHRGVTFDIELFRIFYFNIMFYDHRHWNWSENRFYEPGEEEAQRQLDKEHWDSSEDELS